jgi:hypothetical protein
MKMKIRNGSIAALAALAFTSIAGHALAAGTISTTAPASVTVLSPVTITKTQDLVFGSVVRPNVGTTTTTLDTSDGISQTQAGGGNGSIVASTTSSAKFNVVGPAAQVYTTGQTLTFTQAGLTGVTASLPAATTGTLGTLPASGTQELRYGGSFTMSSATTAQAYTGTLTVTINYN